MTTWQIDQEGRIFFEGRWIAQAVAEPAPASATLAKTELRISAVRPTVPLEVRVEDQERAAAIDRVRVIFSVVTPTLEEWEAAKP